MNAILSTGDSGAVPMPAKHCGVIRGDFLFLPLLTLRVCLPEKTLNRLRSSSVCELSLSLSASFSLNLAALLVSAALCVRVLRSLSSSPNRPLPPAPSLFFPLLSSCCAAFNLSTSPAVQRRLRVIQYCHIVPVPAGGFETRTQPLTLYRSPSRGTAWLTSPAPNGMENEPEVKSVGTSHSSDCCSLFDSGTRQCICSVECERTLSENTRCWISVLLISIHRKGNY